MSMLQQKLGRRIADLRRGRKLTQAQLSRVGALVDGREAEAALRRAQGG